MDSHVKKFFTPDPDGDSPGTPYFEVTALHEETPLEWKDVEGEVGALARGWFELAQLPVEDRIGFTSDFWSSQIPYHPKFNDFLDRFFSNVEDIGVYLTKKHKNNPYDITMVYNLKEGHGFYRGSLPATEDACLQLQSSFEEHIFPEDYFAFAKIHNGFCKTTDSTGIISVDLVKDTYEKLQGLLAQGERLKTSKGKTVDPQSLVPFYESFGMPYFQCFWNEWHPEQEMGNVYCSVSEMMISDPQEGEGGIENLAFKTFTDWLVFYLEQID